MINILGRTSFGLKTKITLLVVFLIVAILISIGYLQMERERKLREREMIYRGQTIARTILTLNVLGDRIPSNQEVRRTLSRFLDVEDVAGDIIFVAFIDGRGRLMAGAVNRNLVQSYTALLERDGRMVEEPREVGTVVEEQEFIEMLLADRVEEASDNLAKIVVQATFEGSGAEQVDLGNLQTIVLGFNRKRLREEILQAALINLSIFFVYIVIGIFASMFLGSAIAKPIKVLEEAMKRVSAGDLNQHVDIPSRDEIGTLARTFNYMTEGLREKEKIKQEFLVAREMQFNLLPRSAPTHKRLEVATYFQPATEVGGDFYDYLTIDEDKLGIIIGDVSGHGMSAGLMMAITKSCLHTQMRYESDLDKLMESVNNILHALSEPRTLVTLFYSVIDFRDLTIKFANAGHPFTYMISGNGSEITPLEAISYPLAIKPGLKFKAQTLKLRLGDFLLFYSDGVPEALNEDETVFGYERLEEILRSRTFESPQDLLESIVGEVRMHIGMAEQFDDMTIVAVRLRE